MTECNNHKELKVERFTNAEELCNFVNDNKICTKTIVQIVPTDIGFYLFYTAV